MIGYPNGQDEVVLPARDTGFVPQVNRSSIGVLSHIINSLSTKLAWSRWLDNDLVLWPGNVEAHLL